MGFASGVLTHLTRLGRAGHVPRGARILEFGSQNLHGEIGQDLVDEFMAAFGGAQGLQATPGAKAEVLMREAGFSYSAFDVYDRGATRSFDLNRDALSGLDIGRYDLVTNLGTSEHVANQYNVFKVAHDALKVGGVMINAVPFYGAINHGLINYHPKFFTSLISNNGYRSLYFGMSDIFRGGDDIDRYLGVYGADNGPAWEGKHVGCAEMCVIWQKASAAPFYPPTDTELRPEISPIPLAASWRAAVLQLAAAARATLRTARRHLRGAR